MSGRDSDGFEVLRTDFLHRLKVIVAVIDELFRVLFHLKEREPCNHGIIKQIRPHPTGITGLGLRDLDVGRSSLPNLTIHFWWVGGSRGREYRPSGGCWGHGFYSSIHSGHIFTAKEEPLHALNNPSDDGLKGTFLSLSQRHESCALISFCSRNCHEANCIVIQFITFVVFHVQVHLFTTKTIGPFGARQLCAIGETKLDREEITNYSVVFDALNDTVAPRDCSLSGSFGRETRVRFWFDEARALGLFCRDLPLQKSRGNLLMRFSPSKPADWASTACMFI